MMYQVPLYGQKFGRSCWAASIRMILAYNGTKVDSDNDIAFPISYGVQLQGGLQPNDTRPLKHWGLTTEAPKTYTEQGIIDLVRHRGPLWVACDVRTAGYSPSVPHVRVIRGVRDAQTPVALMINDPSPIGLGRQYDETYEEFVRKNELLGATEASNPNPVYIAYLA